ncbi:hypothetical protein GCM10010532_027350 [Dactylosporangium siamense]|uniref:TIGR04222 domain-containing membrane protein n=1 Tax=Dactylosporangium siamense TaxID=685454 RepID=A0A919PHQ6_9ACTN|nr:hypothetical protein Dsi01nite_004840 [Dactylosporangium siamense]
MAGVVTAGAAAFYAGLLAVWLRRCRRHRRAGAGYLRDIEIEPFHALAKTGWSSKVVNHAAMEDAAVATLLIDELVVIDTEGKLTPTARGGDPTYAPEHGVVAAWLECLRRAEGPATVSQLRDDPELRQRCEAFVQEQDALLDPPTSPPSDSFIWVLYLVAPALGLFYATLMVSPGEPGLTAQFLGGVFEVALFGLTYLTAAIFMILAYGLYGLAGYPHYPDVVREHCVGLPPHPATAALGADERALLLTSAGSAATPAGADS